MELMRYENMAAPQLAALLDGDRYTFSVMRNILMGVFGPVSKIVSDGHRLLLCYTCPPFPGWVWTPEDASEEEMARAWALVQRELPPEAGFRVNMRPELARYILGTAAGASLHVDMQLNAYGCEQALMPHRMAEGDCCAVSMAELDLATDWLMDMKAETRLDPMTPEACREEMRSFIACRRLFMWKLPDGQYAAMCAVTEEDGMGYLGHVYTPAAHRRKGYAASMVYQITRILLQQGKKPALCVVSTNTPAAACYERLGYRVVGSFCTVGSMV